MNCYTTIVLSISPSLGSCKSLSYLYLVNAHELMPRQHAGPWTCFTVFSVYLIIVSRRDRLPDHETLILLI